MSAHAGQGFSNRKPFEPVPDLLEKFLGGGGRIGICKSCMIHNGYAAGQMVDGYEIVTAPEVIDLMMGAPRVLA
ncbi:hypothetical protein [Pseudogemmobacter sonorensis]|uniref:hypothetical protein n=1 Tax=Pseudogemmobacter sonorensis TaxID=2989681 RepID=UPI00367B4CA9